MSDFRARQRLFRKESLGLLVTAQKATLFRFTKQQTEDLVLRLAGSLEAAYEMGRKEAEDRHFTAHHEAGPPASSGDGERSGSAGGG